MASILDMQRLKAILASWPDRQPAEYTPEENHLLAIPDALGTAYFIENVTGANYAGGSDYVTTLAEKGRQLC